MSQTTGSEQRKTYLDLDYIVLDNGAYGAPSSFVSSQAIWRPSPDFLSIGLFYNEGTPDYVYFGSAGDYRIPVDGAGSISNPAILEHLQIGTGVGTTAVEIILDEDAMGSNSDTALATQQSIKAYVDAAVLGGISITDSYIAVGTGTSIEGTSALQFDGTWVTIGGALQVGSNAQINAIETTDDWLYLNGRGTGGVRIGYHYGTGGLQIFPGSSSGSVIRLESDGSGEFDGGVGIGVTAPAVGLGIYHASTNNLMHLESGDSNVSFTMADSATVTNTAIQTSGDSLYFKVSASGNIYFQVDSTTVGYFGTTGNLILNHYIQLETGTNVNNIQTTISDSDDALPTSGAVVDYVTTTLGVSIADTYIAVGNDSGIEGDPDFTWDGSEMQATGITPVKLYRASNTVGFGVGLNFALQDSSSAQQVYNTLYSLIVDNTAGSETGRFGFYGVNAGSGEYFGYWSPISLVVNTGFQFGGSGQLVDEIVISGLSPTAIGASSTDSQLATAAAVYEYVQSIGGGSQWIDDTYGIYYDSGNVGIMANSEENYSLYIEVPETSTRGAYIKDLSSSNGRRILELNTTAASSGMRFSRSSDYWDWVIGTAGELRFDHNDAANVFYINASSPSWSLIINETYLKVGTYLRLAYGSDVNDIVASGTSPDGIGAWSLDSELATAKAIYDYIESVGGGSVIADTEIAVGTGTGIEGDPDFTFDGEILKMLGSSKQVFIGDITSFSATPMLSVRGQLHVTNQPTYYGDANYQISTYQGIAGGIGEGFIIRNGGGSTNTTARFSAEVGTDHFIHFDAILQSDLNSADFRMMATHNDVTSEVWRMTSDGYMEFPAGGSVNEIVESGGSPLSVSAGSTDAQLPTAAAVYEAIVDAVTSGVSIGDNQVVVGTGTGIEGTSYLTWDGSDLGVAGNIVLPDSVTDTSGYIYLGDNNDMHIYHNGTNSIIYSTTTDLWLAVTSLSDEIQMKVGLGTPLTVANGGITLASGATVNNIQTTITDTDSAVPTSGAVVDYVSSNTYWKRTGTTLEPVTNGDDILLTSGEALYLYSTSNYITGTSSGITVASSGSITLASGTSIWTVNSNVLEVSASTFEIGEDAKDSALFAVHFDAADDNKPDDKNIVFYLYDLEAPLYSYIHGQGTPAESLSIKYKANNEHNFYYNDHEVWTEVARITPDGIYPGANNTYSLGNISYQWSYLFVDSTAYIDNLQLTSGATVNTIQTTLSSSSTALATSSAIIAYVAQSNLGWINASGTPANNQVAVFTDANTIEGDANFTWDATTLTATNMSTQSLKLAITKMIYSDTEIILDIDNNDNDTASYFAVTMHNGATELFRVDDDGSISIGGGQAIDEIVTSVTSGSTDSQLPTAAAVYDALSGAGVAVPENLVALGSGTGIQSDPGFWYLDGELVIDTTGSPAENAKIIFGDRYTSPSNCAYIEWVETSDAVYTRIDDDRNLLYVSPASWGIGEQATSPYTYNPFLSASSGDALGVMAFGISTTGVLTAVLNSSGLSATFGSGTHNVLISEALDSIQFEVNSTVMGGFTLTGFYLTNSAVKVDTIETTISNDDTHIPTSGAVYDELVGKVDIGTGPTANRIMVWENTTTAKGDANLTWSASTLTVTGSINLTANLQFDAGQTVDTITTDVDAGSLDTELPTAAAVWTAISGASENYYLDGVTVNSISDVDFTMTGTADITGIDFSHTHAIGEITNLTTELAGKVDIGTGPVANRLLVWSDTTTAKGDANLTWASNTLTVDGVIKLLDSDTSSDYLAIGNDTDIQMYFIPATGGWIQANTTNFGIYVTDTANEIRFYVGISEKLNISTNGVSLSTGATVDNIQTTMTSVDTAIPTSGAVLDELAGYAQIGTGPGANRIAVWEDASTIGGDTDFIWDGSALRIQSSTDQVVEILQQGLSSNEGVPVAGWNILAFLDSDADRQGYVGIDASGNIRMITEVSGGVVYTSNDMQIVGDLTINTDLQVDGNFAFNTGSSVSEIENALTDSATKLPTSHAVYDAIAAISLTAPTVATNLQLSEQGEYISVTFDTDEDNDCYEVWSTQEETATSPADGLAYNLVAIIKGDEFQGSPGSSVTIADNTYTRKSTVYYKIYAKKFGVYSSALEGSITPTADVADVTGVTVDTYTESIAIYWVNPTDRRLDYVEVKVDAQAVEGNLDEGNATSCYVGKDENFTYQIPTADLTKYHEFWIYTYTKT